MGMLGAVITGWLAYRAAVGGAGDRQPAAAAVRHPADLHRRAARHARPARRAAGADVSRVAEQADLRDPRDPRIAVRRTPSRQRRFAERREGSITVHVRFSSVRAVDGGRLCRRLHPRVPMQPDRPAGPRSAENHVPGADDRAVARRLDASPSPTRRQPWPAAGPRRHAVRAASAESFPARSTVVTCTATDAQSRTDACTFTVTVAAAATDQRHPFRGVRRQHERRRARVCAIRGRGSRAGGRLCVQVQDPAGGAIHAQTFSVTDEGVGGER